MRHVDFIHIITLNKNDLSFKCGSYFRKLGKYTRLYHVAKTKYFFNSFISNQNYSDSIS
jgi:hypothetical protein